MVEEFDSHAFREALRQTVRKWRPGIVQLEFTQMAQYADACGSAKTVLVEHDVTLDLYAQLLARGEDWETRQQFERWVGFEREAWSRVDAVVVMSEKDRRSVGRDNAVVLANGVDLTRFQPAARDPEPGRILFIGSFAHLPNVLAVDWFVREVWPLLRSRESGARLHVIAGARHQYFLDRYREQVNPPLCRGRRRGRRLRPRSAGGLRARRRGGCAAAGFGRDQHQDHGGDGDGEGDRQHAIGTQWTGRSRRWPRCDRRADG